MNMSEPIYEKYYPQGDSENEEEIVETLTLFDYQEHLETDYGASSQIPRLRMLIASLKEAFSKESFTINYVLIINSVIIMSIILSIWLLTLIGGIFNNFILILGIITIVLILMIFESLTLLENELTQKEENRKLK